METLADRIAREGPLNELDAVGWAIRLAKRIEGMHALGVTHGSLSPSCLLIGATDRAARAQLVDVRRSSPSLSCQSPERVNGGGLSQADDTWALACTLYAALTGSSPFSGANDADVKQKIVASAPAPLAVFDVGDDDLQRIFDDAFARDIGDRTTSVAALRTALEEWHPDPNVGALPAVEEEEDAEPAGFSDDDDEDQRTIMRSSPGTAPRVQLPGSAGFPQVVPPRASPRAVSPGFPPPVSPPAALPGSAPPDDDDDDEDARTVMRTVPEHLARSALAGGASRSGAFAAMTPGKSGAFPAGAPLPEVGDEHDDDEATRMMSTPAQLAQDDDDDDEQKTLMRSSTPEEAAARTAGSAGSERVARPLPAAGARPAAREAPPPAAAFPGPAPAPSWGAASGAAPGIGVWSPAEAPGAPPVLPAAPLPVAAVPGAAPVALAGGPAPLAAPPARRTAVWLVLLTLIVAAGATYAFLRMR